MAKSMKCMESLHLQCLFYFFKLCGLAPVNFNIQEIDYATVKRWRFTRCWIGIVYNLILIFAIIALSYLIIYTSFNTVFATLGFDGTVYAVVDSCSIFGTVFIILVYCIQHKRVSTLFDKVSDTREIIESNNNSNYKPKALFYRVLTLLVVNVVVWIFMITTMLMYEYNSVLTLCVLNVCIFIRNALTLQYCIVLKLIEHLFSVLNRNLSDLSKDLCIPQEVPSDNTVEIENRLSELWEWYSQLSKLTREVSGFYSFPMLLNILAELLMTITIVYYLFEPLLSGGAALPTLTYMSSFSAVLAHVCPIILLTSSVFDATSESQTTTEIVNDYLKESKDRTIKEKLLQFSIYMLHSDIQFTVFDLFSINGSLLVSIAVSMTTYLVILLDFQSKSIPPDYSESTTEST